MCQPFCLFFEQVQQFRDTIRLCGNLLSSQPLLGTAKVFLFTGRGADAAMKALPLFHISMVIYAGMILAAALI